MSEKLQTFRSKENSWEKSEGVWEKNGGGLEKECIWKRNEKGCKKSEFCGEKMHHKLLGFAGLILRASINSDSILRASINCD